MISQNGKQVERDRPLRHRPRRQSDARGKFRRSCPTSRRRPILDFTRDGIVQGAVEGSNVDPVREMARLIEVTRAFDGVAAENSQSEVSLTDAIKALGSST